MRSAEPYPIRYAAKTLVELSVIPHPNALTCSTCASFRVSTCSSSRGLSARRPETGDSAVS
ncbi:hypothetical protein N136_00472 [Leifsonia aquatica ATCC 14665]|uniref:Uncharacterized protein n=1 Tax=Leifsonia aquatica ATCC 14665 TaxID=1358026 RepID=U2RXA6_LEIAQ|nr:hypothetical protein N136_00472 [Leifsonia aquatica ATCC 14665]